MRGITKDVVLQAAIITGNLEGVKVVLRAVKFAILLLVGPVQQAMFFLLVNAAKLVISITALRPYARIVKPIATAASTQPFAGVALLVFRRHTTGVAWLAITSIRLRLPAKTVHRTAIPALDPKIVLLVPTAMLWRVNSANSVELELTCIQHLNRVGTAQAVAFHASMRKAV